MARRTTQTSEEMAKTLAQIGIDTEVINCKDTTAENLTLLKAFEQLLDMAEDSKLQPTMLKRAKRLTTYIGNILDINPVQAVLLAVILNGDRDEYVEMSYISRTLGCRNVSLLRYLEDLDSLRDKGLVQCVQRREDHGYRVPMAVIDALKQNQSFKRPDMTGLTIEQLFVYPKIRNYHPIHD